MTKLFTRPTSHYILIIIFAVILFSGLYYSAKVSEQIKRHFYLDILKIQIESVPIFQC